ncbi:FAD binding domain-containing protein [Dactylonectria estremocensis]|uniref:FAD binding domain-containing protein n=1 Tax=Dactylonectria estremocensis TaxID=1079267 RepID=A0A9P9FJ07_9HYPO|nr:FAD binding domain-containing protein [Dactylonectria estremocensis]
MANVHETAVLIVGAGPAGMLLAFQLAKNGVRSILVERNLTTTKWPKMDITNCRSMELFKRLGIAQDLRDQGVDQHHSFDVLFSTGLSDGGELISKWDLPSPNDWRTRIRAQNDGSMPREPYQRCSQSIFEAWLKLQIETEPLIQVYFGLKFEGFVEVEGGVQSTGISVVDKTKHIINSGYLVGCDGAGSRVRKCLGSELVGGPTPVAMFLVHFKSRDLSALHKQGQFWHIFFTSGSVIISQDEVNTWTVHLPISLDTDWKSLDPEKAIADVLGGSLAPHPIKVDEILVSSSWQPSIAVAERYASDSLRVFLSGDSAHQNIPTGGYGMNTAVGDSFDLGWKLSAVINGQGGEHLLRSYEIERKPVAIRNIERSGVHFKVHRDYVQWVAEAGPGTFSSTTPQSAALHDRIRDHVLEHPGENQDQGIEMGYRYNGSPIVLRGENAEEEPESDFRRYVASTWPGGRAPHVYLSDGETSIFDLFGAGFTLVDFSRDGWWAREFSETSTRLGIQLKAIRLPQETHLRDVWGRDAVLVRPDDHVAWRAPIHETGVNVERVLKTATGYDAPEESPTDLAAQAIQGVKQQGFTSTLSNADEKNTKQVAVFQK